MKKYLKNLTALGVVAVMGLSYTAYPVHAEENIETSNSENIASEEPETKVTEETTIPAETPPQNISLMNNTVSPLANNVASVTVNGITTEYSDIVSAFNAANGRTATITILQDCSLDGDISITSGNITVYGGGKTITRTRGAGIVIEGGTVNVYDFNYNDSVMGIVVYGGIFNFFSGNFNSSISSLGPGNYANGTVNIYGGTISRVNSYWGGGVYWIPNSITMQESNVSMEIDSNHQLVANVDQNQIIVGGNNIKIGPSWTSSDDDIVSVDAQGYLTAHSIGTATITASAGGKNATCTVTVTKKTQDAPNLDSLAATYIDNDSMILDCVHIADFENLQYAYVEGNNANAPTSDDEWKDVTKDTSYRINLTNLEQATPYTIFLRYKETDNMATSKPSSKVFTTMYSSADAKLDYEDETISVSKANSNYQIDVNNGDISTVTSDETGAIPIDDEWFGNTITIRLIDAPESVPQGMAIPARPTTPSLSGEVAGSGKNDCKITGLKDNVSYEVSSDNGQTWKAADVNNGEITGLSLGTYQVRVKAVKGSSFASLPATVTIEKVDSTIGFKKNFSLNKTYDTKAVSITADDVETTGSTGNISFTYEKKTGDTWETLQEAPTGAGTYRVTATLAGDNNYNSATSQPLEFTIDKADTILEFTVDDLDKVYDGKAVSAPTKQSGNSHARVLSWYQLGEDGQWTKLEKAPVNVGNYKVVATVEADNNYNGAEIEMTFVITKAIPAYTLPADFIIKQGEALSSLELPDGFTWKDDTQTADTLGTQTFKAIFTPEDTVNYQTVEVDIPVEVVPAMSTINRIPVITAEDKTLTVGDTFEPEKDVTASDKEDGDITDKIEIIDNMVDTSNAGTYTVTYKVTDKDGASATKTITVTVKEKDKEEQPTAPTNPDKGDNNNHDKNNTASNTDKPDTSVKTGDNTNILLWSMVAVISFAGMITALLFKRKRSR